MSIHQPILPARAIELVEARNLKPAETLLADFAAAGLIKTYALVREIKPAGGPTATVRDSQIPQDEWDRIIASNKVALALNGGTVRLEGAPLKGGLSQVQITGISFSEASLTKVLDRYCAQSSKGAQKPLSAQSTDVETDAATALPLSKARNQKDVLPIKQGDLTASVAQTMQATGLGRTKIDRLMKEGKLVRTKVGRRTLITVESIERLVGAKIAS